MDPSVQRLTRIVSLIELTSADLRGRDASDFERDRRLVDATAFRVMHIGENAIWLDKAIHERNSELPWRGMRGMRNLIAHKYEAIDPTVLWRTVHDTLGPLKLVCLTELDANNNPGD